MPRFPDVVLPQRENTAVSRFLGIEKANTAVETQKTNSAAALLQGQAKLDQSKIDMEKWMQKKMESERKMTIEANDFALSLLSGVNSQEDLDIAKRQFLARYPESRGMIDNVLPSYNERSINLIKNSLKDETNKLKWAGLREEERAAKVGEEETERSNRAQEGIERRKLESPKAFSPGSDIYQGSKKIGSVPTKTQTKYDLFEDPDGNPVYVPKGAKIPEGYKAIQKSGTTVNVNTGDVTTATKTQLQKDIIEATRNIKSFQKTGDLFKDEYLTYWGKGKKEIAQLMDKAGISTQNQRGFINEYNTWFRQAKADFIAYRKWATGVAGGEKELKEIATSFPDPVENSPQQYKTNLESLEETTKEVPQLNRDFLELGIDLDQPLDKILEEAERAGVEMPPGYGKSSNKNVIRTGTTKSGVKYTIRKK